MCKHIYNQEKTYPEGTSFTYLLTWTELNIHYYGVRYSKNCHPDDLWTTYFTSSNIVKKFIKKNGSPDLIKIEYVFDTGIEAREYEENYIRTNNCVYENNWLNKCNGGKDYCCIGHTDETKLKMKNSHLGIIRGPHSEETKRKISTSNKGRKQPMSEEDKQKRRKPKKCRDNYKELKKGFIWITNGTINKIINPETFSDYPEWIKGCSKNTEYLKNASEKLTGSKIMNNGVIQKQISKEFVQEYLDNEWVFGRLNKHIGQPHTEETKQKLSDIFKGSKFMNNGFISKQIKKEFVQEYLDNNWIFGRLKKHK